MPYKLQNLEPLEIGLKRIAEEQLTAGIQDLQARKVYELRKRIKKVRAILRLLKSHLGPLYVEENRRLGDIARRFSARRDLDVSLELIETLSSHYKRKTTLNPHRHALLQKRSALPNLDAVISESCDILSGTRKRIEDWPLHQLSSSFIDSQLEKTHGQSRRALERARSTRKPEDFHEFRKSVKRELNQVRLFSTTSESEIKRLDRLGSLLGDHHNLVILLQNVDSTSTAFSNLVVGKLRLLESPILTLGTTHYEEGLSAAVA